VRQGTSPLKTHWCFTGHVNSKKLRTTLYEGVSKSFRAGRMERELQMVQLSAIKCSCVAILWASLVSFAAITLCVASQRVFIVVKVYFFIDSVRKLLDTLSYIAEARVGDMPLLNLICSRTVPIRRGGQIRMLKCTTLTFLLLTSQQSLQCLSSGWAGGG
jgi:hypothetical protein